MSIVSSLFIGVSALVIIFIALKIMTPIRAPRIAIIEAFISLGLYIPYGMIQWQGVDVFAMHIGVFLITAYILGVVGSHWDKRGENESFAKWFHWAPASIILFFVVLVVVDSTFVTVATQGLPPTLAKWILPEPQHHERPVKSHFPGVVERDYRRTDSDFIDYQKKLVAQQNLGWAVNKGWLNTDKPKVGENAIFQVQVSDKNNQPVSGLTIEGSFLRLSNHKKDIPFIMKKIDEGLFQILLNISEPGRWNVYLRISKGDQLYETQSSTLVDG